MANFPKAAPSIGRSTGLAGPAGATGAGVPGGGVDTQALLVNHAGAPAFVDQPSINAKAWGVVADGVTDDTAAWQAIAARVKALAGLGAANVIHPGGISIISGQVNWDQSFGFAISGPVTGGQINTMPARIAYTGTGTTPMFTFNSSTNWSVNHIGFEYRSTSFTGVLINVDGGPFGADVQNWAFNGCGFRQNTGGASSAQSAIRLNKALIGNIYRCQFAGYGEGLRLGDPGGSYIVELTVEKTGFNSPGNGRHVFVGTGDGESIVFRDCGFEGAYTSYYGVNSTRDGAQNRLYAFREENCWHGDNVGADYVDGLFSQEGCSIVNGRFAGTSGTHCRLGGVSWSVEDTSFEGGIVFDQLSGSALSNLNVKSPYYVNVVSVFNPTNFGALGYPLGSYTAFGPVTSGVADRTSNQVTQKFGVLAPTNDFIANALDGDLLLGARVNPGYQPTQMLSPVNFIVTPVATGGTFAAATYFWQVTAVNAAGETLPSAEVSQAIVLNGSAKVQFGPVPGATSYNIYRATSSGAENVSPALAGVLTPPQAQSGNRITFTDTGAAVTAGAIPAANTAHYSQAVISKAQNSLLIQAPWSGTVGDISLGVGNAGTNGAPTTALQVAAGPKIGAFGAAAVVQPNTTGNVHTVTAGATTNVFTNTTFDGSTGSTAYTVGDIVKALKALGFLAS